MITSVTSAAPTSDSTEPEARASNFDYSRIALGYYDTLTREGNPIRRLWHLAKFERVIEYLPTRPGQRLLDIGCFAGTFLGMVDTDQFSYQLGVDILPEQIAFARQHYAHSAREFRCLRDLHDLGQIDYRFDCITFIEVIEHLNADEIRTVLTQAARLLAPGGSLVLTTPNYASTWPLLEVMLNRFSDLSYEEQHITKFTYWNLGRRLVELVPSFSDQFELQLKTTTHFITPFLAALSFDRARQLSRAVPHKMWRFPLGNLVLAVFQKK